MDYPITTPTAPGDYTSAALEEQNGTLTVRADGTAITSSTIRGTTYSHPILNLPSWAELFGPFRELDDEDDTDPDGSAAVALIVNALADELEAAMAAPDTETPEITPKNDPTEAAEEAAA